MRPLRIGLVCPYSMSTPGGVQNHVLGLAGWLAGQGHQPAILAPDRPSADILAGYRLNPHRYTSCGHGLPIAYNGSLARVNFGPATAARTRAWLGDGNFDLVHVHEPLTPSAALFATRAAQVPVVATYHLATPRSRALALAGRTLRGTLARVGAHVAVSETAREVVRSHLGIEPVVIPNGFRAADFGALDTDHANQGGAQVRVAIMFLGRIDEPRKGLEVLLDALPAIYRELPEAQVWVVGPGQRRLPAGVWWFNSASDTERAELLRQATVFVAPHLGRESFGLVLVEAMAAGVAVVASDLPAFREVLTGDDCTVLGRLVPPGDPSALATAVLETVRHRDPARSAQGTSHVQRFDWTRVGPQIHQVYNSVVIA